MQFIVVEYFLAYTGSDYKICLRDDKNLFFDFLIHEKQLSLYKTREKDKKREKKHRRVREK